MIKRLLFGIIILIALYGCGNRNNDRRQTSQSVVSTETTVDSTKETRKTVVNVYIENSGSMDGFIKGITSFKDAISAMLVQLKYHYDEENVNVFYICNNREEKLCVKNAIETDISDFAHSIDVSWKKAQIDDDGQKLRGNNTNLNNIFKEILKNANDTTITILFSDCIYSIGKGETVNMLNYEKSMTYDAFLTRSKMNKEKNLGDLSTIIIKMMSSFDGKYYPFTGDENGYYFNNKLPYYICIIANQNLLTDFNTNIELNKLDGYENKYVISNSFSDNLFYSILLTTYKKGEFKTQRDYSTNEYIHGIESLKAPKNGNLSFAIAVNMNNIDVEDDYKTDMDNYVLSNNNIKIKAIKPISEDDISNTDWVKIRNGNPSHVIILEATKLNLSDFTIELKKQMPGWIEASNIMDDTDPKRLVNGKSFGLKYWIEGIAEAYEKIYPDEKNYYKLEIKIKK